MGVTSDVFSHLSWVARQVSASTGDEADPWALGGNPNSSAADIARSFRWVSIVDEVILSFTVLGSLAILGSMFLLEYKGRPATTRMRIVQSLVLSDLILGLVGVVGTSLLLSGSPLEPGTNACSGLGYSLVVVLWTEHLWTLILAVATYMILIYPLHPVTLWLERRWYWLWILVWVLAAAIGLVGYFVFGFFPNGGICYYGVNAGLYSELIQFIPRASVMLIISILYARLFVFLRRPDKIHASFSTTSNGGTGGVFRSFQGRKPRYLFRSSALSGMLSRGRKASEESGTSDTRFKAENEKGHSVSVVPSPVVVSSEKIQREARSASQTRDEEAGSGTATPRAFRLITPPSTPDEPAPWEQVQLPIFHIDGERFGGREAAGSGAQGGQSSQRETSSLWGGWKGIGKSDDKRDRQYRRNRASTLSSTSPPPTNRSRFGSTSASTLSRDPPASPKSAGGISVFPPTVEIDVDADYDEDPHRTPTQTRNNSKAGEVWHGTANGRHGSMSSSLADGVQRFRKPSAVSAFSYRVNEEPDSSTLSSGPTPAPSRRGSAQQGEDAQARTALTPEIRLNAHHEEEGQLVGARESRGVAVGEQRDDDEEDEDTFDLMRMLQASGDGERGGRSQNDGEELEIVEESMASYLNRKTALLMLWFPLGYVLLFSVSLIRIIYDFVGEPPIALRAVSRWFIFSQGILDALIYGLVEWHTKRVVRKRVRKGTFNTPTASRGRGTDIGTGSALNALRSFGQGSKGLFSSRTGSQQIGQSSTTMSSGSIPVTDRQGGRTTGQSMSRPSNRTPTTSFIPPIPEGRTIEQQLEEDNYFESETNNSGSGTGSGSGYDMEEDSTRKGSTASEKGLGAEVSYVSEGDGRSRERRKGN